MRVGISRDAVNVDSVQFIMLLSYHASRSAQDKFVEHGRLR